VDAHGYGKRFIVRADEMLTAVRRTAKGDTRIRGEFDSVVEVLHRIINIIVRADES
jgi:hypothetical protein